MQKKKWLSEEALQIVEKRREVKDKENERYIHLNAEFQRIVRRDKKVFLSDHCKEIEKDNRMGKTRDLFKETRDIRGTFHVRMGVAQRLKGLPLMLETWVRSLGREDPLEKEMATHSSILV